MPETLYLIDTMSLVFQVYHAIPEMTGPKGQPTNAVFGFARDLKMILEAKHPAYVVCAMDSSGPGERNEIYEEYKANRKEMPEDLQPQIPLIEEMIEGFGVPAVEYPGWEADDVIATLAREAAEQGMDVVIVSADKDLRQLLGPHVRMYNCRKDAFLDEEALMQEWGVRPDQVVDFQALVGDATDNVPGVPLVGPKKAAALLNEFGGLEDVLARADEAPGKKLRENLKSHAEQARVSRRLVELKTDLPLEFDWEQARVREPDRGRLLKLFSELGFRRLSDEMRQGQPKASATKAAGSLFPTTADNGSTRLPEKDSRPPSTRSQAEPGNEEISRHALASGSTGEPWANAQRLIPEREWEIADTDEKFAALLDQLRQQKKFCFDLETTSLDALRAEIVGWAFSWQAGSGYYVPVAAPPGETVLDAAKVLEALRPLLEDPRFEIVNQNIKYEILILRRHGVMLQGIGLDPMVGDYLLDAGARSHGLDQLAKKYLNHRMIPISELIGKGRDQKLMSEVPVARVAEYASEDADIAWRLAERIEVELRTEGLWDLYWELERPLIPVLVEMESNGIRVDPGELAAQSRELVERQQRLVAEIHELAGREFNIDSPKQLAVVLFEELKLPALKRTRTGRSTSQDVLERLATMHPLPAKITEHRHLAKLRNTYLDALPLLVNPTTGRLHTSFNQVVAATGRLSSNEPNLQNIPVRTPEGRRIRRAFIPRDESWRLICADYSQIELRLAAHFSGDEALKESFRRGEDIHAAVASQIFGVDPRDVDANMRRVAKAVNFGVIYGQSPFGLAQALGIEQSAAAEFIDSYFTRYAGVDRFLTGLLEEVARSGFAKTILGRRREIKGIRSTTAGPVCRTGPDAAAARSQAEPGDEGGPARQAGPTGRQRNLPERTAINTVIQGSAADLIKRAMINVHERLVRERHPGRMLLQIHDELVFEAPKDAIDSLIEIAREEMTTALELTVPLVVDIKIGQNWLDAEPAG